MHELNLALLQSKKIDLRVDSVSNEGWKKLLEGELVKYDNSKQIYLEKEWLSLNEIKLINYENI